MISPCGKNRRLFRDLKKNLETSKIVYNQTLFYIRNLYTGLHKEEVLRTDNERKVISTVIRYIQEINEKNQKKGRKPYPFPDRERASLSRNLLVMVMSRVFRDGYALDTAYAAKLLQNCVRQVWTNMDSFFRALSDYQKSPSKYQGRPRIPGYLKGRFFMLRYDRQMLKPVEGKKGFSLSFSKLQRSLYLGHLHPERTSGNSHSEAYL
jgi:putative transposase